MNQLGTCYGFGVDSELPFRFLRGGEGDKLDVFVSPTRDDDAHGDLLQEWSSPDPPGHEIRIYDDEGRYRLWSTVLGWFTIDPSAPSIGVPETELDIAREQMTLVTASLLCFHARGDLPLHAAAIDIGGEAILLAAPGSFGKTTLSAAFWRSGYRVLSEDLTCLRRSPEHAAIPGPAMIRLRRDVAEELDLPDVETVVETPTRVCFAFDEARRGDCSPVPVRAVILLLTSDDDFRLERVDATTAARDLWTLSGLFPTDEDFSRRFEAATDLAGAVPVFTLSRALRFEGLDRIVERIVASV
jgi:hypothetical protein